MKSIYEFGSRTNRFEVIEPNVEADAEFGFRNGGELLEVTQEQIMALLEGKAWAFEVNDGEYSHFVVMKKEGDDEEGTICIPGYV